MVADNALAVFSDEKALNTLVKDNRTLLQKVHDFFKQFADKLKEVKQKLSKSSIVYSEVNHDIDFLEQSAEKIKTMLDSVKETTSKQSDMVKHSKNTDFSNQVDEWYRNGHDNNEAFIIGDTGDVLQGLGAIDNQIYFYGSKINAILKKHSDTMSLDIIKKVPDIIDNPALVLSSHSRNKKNNTRLLLFGMVKGVTGKPVMCVLDLQPVENGLLISDMQKLTSAYSLTRGQKGIYDYLNNCDVLYVSENKKIATKLVGQIGFVDPKKGLPIELQQSGYIGNISYSGRSVNVQGVPFSEVFNTKVDNVNKKFSLNTSVDSEGNELTNEQQEYFKDSKVRDEDGNLLVVYHGSYEDFTVFDKTKGRANMDIQGMFFSPLELDAEDYGPNVKAYYLNITNPADEQTGYKALKKYQGQNEAGIKAREYLESLGYDGVNNGNEEYIAFNSNQIKLIDNAAPTDKSDIRYSKDTNFTKALTGDEKKKYNNAIMTGNDNGLRISDNSILVECENKSEYQYKYVVY
ncbi:MAG: hypothetical protein Q4C64_08845, partial [Erysipelotrichia bacterium]|nr:hypothetical protein [Erysipelotrichia bacterium]